MHLFIELKCSNLVGLKMLIALRIAVLTVITTTFTSDKHKYEKE
ncbi:hypothetical protein [Fictibacillus sp. JL2B1089]